MMKLLRVIPSIDPSGGGPMEGARRIDAELLRLGHQVEVVCLDAPDQLSKVNYPVAVHALGPARFSYRYSNTLVPWLSANRHRFDAVIVNGLWQYHSLAAWRALAGTNTPYFVFSHGMLDPWFKRAYPFKHLKKWLYWPWADYRVLRDAAAVLFTSDEERRQARESFWLYRCSEIVTAYGTEQPPQDENKALAERFLALHPELIGKRVLLYLSRIHEKKGCDLLIEAFSKLSAANPDLHLVMAGPNQTGLQEVLMRQSSCLGISNKITWPGMLQGDEKWGAFHAADAFCLPSHQENFGVVVAEALACGKPVLISNKVNIWREIVEDGAGLVFDDTLEGVRSGLEKWLTLPAAQLAQMGVSAKACFHNRFQINNVVVSLLSTLRAGIEQRTKGKG